MKETKEKPTGKSLEYCYRFAEALLRMEADRDRSSLTARHCLSYAEAGDNPISHGTFYNDTQLKAMLDWACGPYAEREGKPRRHEADGGKKESGTPAFSKKALAVMAKKVLRADNIENEFEDLRRRLAVSEILFNRAQDLLKAYNLSGMLDMNVSQMEIAEKLCTDDQYLIDQDTGEILERPKSEKKGAA